MNCHETIGRATALAGMSLCAALATVAVTGVEALAGITPAAYAQNEIEQIIVTATKRETTVQEVPFSINVQSQEDIQRSGAVNLEQLSRNIAGLTIQNLGPGQSQVAIRGVSAGQIVRDQPGVKEQVGIYLDETVISLSLFTPDIDLYDLNRVETLRGPQGTLFGSGSVGGTIRYITNQPLLGEFEGSLETSLNGMTDGETGGHLKAMFNMPLGEAAALRAVGYTTRYGGYIDALHEDGSITEDVNSGTRNGGRLSLAWQAADNILFTPRIVWQRIETDGFNRAEVYNVLANPFTTTRPPVQLGEREQFLRLPERFADDLLIVDTTVDAELDAVDLLFTTSYTERDILVSRDASALSGSVSVDLGLPDVAVLLPSNLVDTTEVQQFTHELRFSSKADAAVQWVVGAFYSDLERVYAQRLPTVGYDAFVDAHEDFGPGFSASIANGFPADSPFNSDLPYDLQQLALFGEATWDVTDRLHLTAGGRFYDYEESRTITLGGLFANVADGILDETSSTGFTPRVLASYDFSDNVTFNAQAAQGFRLGGVNDPLNATLCTPEDEAIFGGFQSYEDETLWNYEVGMKSTFDNGIRLNAAVFHAEIEDLQVTLDAGSCSSRISFNVPKAHTSGVELEFGAQPMDNLDVSLSGSFIEAEFDSTVIAPSTGAILGGVQDGNRLASVPETQFSASGSYYLPFTGPGDSEPFVSLTFQHVGDRYTQPSDQVPGAGVFVSGLPFGGATGNEATVVDLELDAYEILNFSTGLAGETWEAVLYVNNVTDENAQLSFDRERGGRARLAYRVNQPRTFGITFRLNY